MIVKFIVSATNHDIYYIRKQTIAANTIYFYISAYIKFPFALSSKAFPRIALLSLWKYYFQKNPPKESGMFSSIGIA